MVKCADFGIVTELEDSSTAKTFTGIIIVIIIIIIIIIIIYHHYLSSLSFTIIFKTIIPIIIITSSLSSLIIRYSAIYEPRTNTRKTLH